MSRLRRVIGGVRALFRLNRIDAELDDELRGYLDAATEQNLRAGMSRDQAIRAARVEFGSVDAVKDRVRDVGWETHLDNLWRDVRYSARALRRSPAFAAITMLILTLGIGANTAIFSVVNAVMLRPLPVDRPDELISLAVRTVDGTDSLFSYAAYRRFTAGGAALVDTLAASSARPDAVVLDGSPEPIDYKWVSGNYFAALGVRPAVGRTLTATDDRLPAGQPVAVISDAYWARRFGRDPGAIGRTFRLKATPFTIVGVAPAGFSGETGGEAADIWMPLTSQPDAPSYVWNGHSVTWLRLLARRRPGIAFDQARAGLEPVYGRIRDEIAGEARGEYRTAVLDSRLDVRGARNGSPALRDPLSTPLVVVLSIVGLVLLTACANVATLMLARAAARRRQVAVCLALGAARSRVIRQSLAEAMLLALPGGVGGWLVGNLGTRALTALMSGALPVAIDASPDIRVLGFAILISVATAIACGLLPALRAAAVDPLPALKVGGPGGRGAARIPLGRSLVVGQIAVSSVLLLTAGLFTHSLLKLKQIDAGFDPDHVLLIRVTPPLDERPEPDLYRRLLTRAESVRGVQRASLSSSGGFNNGTWGQAIAVEGFVPQPGKTPRTIANAVSERYFEVMRIPILRGRPFTAADRLTSQPVAVVNETFVHRFVGDRDPIGTHVGLCSGDLCAVDPARVIEIVGLARDAKYANLREASQPMLYLPFTQQNQTLRELEVRTAGDPAPLAATLRRELADIDRRLTAVSTIELREHVDASLVAERLTALLSTAFGLLSLALAAIGLYGVIAYATLERTAEIGLRMALGAGRRQVRRLVIGDIFWLVVIGLAIGLPAALAVTRLLEHQLYAITPADPAALIAALAMLVVTAFVAGYLPARRATRVDPLIALRAE